MPRTKKYANKDDEAEIMLCYQINKSIRAVQRVTGFSYGTCNRTINYYSAHMDQIIAEINKYENSNAIYEWDVNKEARTQRNTIAIHDNEVTDSILAEITDNITQTYLTD